MAIGKALLESSPCLVQFHLGLVMLFAEIRLAGRTVLAPIETHVFEVDPFRISPISVWMLEGCPLVPNLGHDQKFCPISGDIAVVHDVELLPYD